MKRLNVIFIFILLTLSVYAQPKQEYEPPQLHNAASWSMILIPDPQTYIKFDYNQPLFEFMTAWIAHNIKPLNISLILCTGDLVEQNDILNPDGKNGNQPSISQWKAVARAFDRLDGKAPYILATGNHDYGYKAAENRRSHYDTYFPIDKNPCNQLILRDAGFNTDGEPTLANATFEYVSPTGKKYLVLVLEFAPRDATLDWASKMIANKKYADHTVILLTHSYLNADNKHIEKEGYKLENPNYGAAIWQKLVQPSRNIRLVLCGHIGAANDERAHLGYRVDKNAFGKSVVQMAFNAQALGGGWHGNGGDGWLRILEFKPDGKTVHVSTFSPLFAASPVTRQFAWRRNTYDEFTFEID